MAEERVMAQQKLTDEPSSSLPATIEREPNPVKRFLKILGPGFITGASDDDPSGIGTYAIAGASLGLATLWTALLTFPFMAAVQNICARIGMVSGIGLAGVLRERFPRPILYAAVALLAIANTINVGADLGAVADAAHLITGAPAGWLIAPVAAAILALQVFAGYRLIANVFKWLTLALLAYVVDAVIVHPDPAAIRYGTIDVNVGMAFSNLAMYFIILATATTLFASGRTDINTAADAAEALRPIAGDLAGLIFAVGMIGAGVLAVPILSGSAAYAVAETFGWRYGLEAKWWRARPFYGVIVISTLVGVLLNFTGIASID